MLHWYNNVNFLPETIFGVYYASLSILPFDAFIRYEIFGQVDVLRRLDQIASVLSISSIEYIFKLINIMHTWVTYPLFVDLLI